MDHEEAINKCPKYGDIIMLKDWLEKQPHLPKNVDNELLKAFVCGTKTLEDAKKKLDTFFTVRGRFPKLFQNVHMDLLDANFREASMCRMFYLPQKTPEGYSLLFMKCLPGDMDKFSHILQIRRVVMLMELGMYFWPEITGLSLIVDMKDFSKSYLNKLNPSALASYFTYFQEAYPIKLKKMTLFNTNSFANMLVNFIKPFMKPKIFQRIQLSDKDFTILAQYYDTETLPSDYGGREESSNVLDDKWYQRLVDHSDWFKKTSMLISDETKRPPDEQDTYGIQGTFRTLAID
ncbi:alpha-tocopherol transfer protein-like [Halyomorpha halys]|uniref:alpha-tocopherol transfer protein-like n=1 Tax=Halyomorpha halys TaxID=286706 RepID=UPI0006D4D305|nr:alpha-tocopherol transfer protein-like [Halyomorpha halys]